MLQTPETLVLSAGKTARLKVRVQRFDDATGPLTLTAEPPLEGVKFEHNVLQPGANQIELRVTAATEIKQKSFRLRAGDAVSPSIELKAESAEENSR